MALPWSVLGVVEEAGKTPFPCLPPLLEQECRDFPQTVYPVLDSRGGGAQTLFSQLCFLVGRGGGSAEQAHERHGSATITGGPCAHPPVTGPSAHSQMIPAVALDRSSKSSFLVSGIFSLMLILPSAFCVSLPHVYLHPLYAQGHW